ncbi:MAG: hypothetical protein IV090_16145 [Candidatus Sericytochromatia bacterium]|nr:hypothetical protein [Candidatus Sericytochromatia bacterium]
MFNRSTRVLALVFSLTACATPVSNDRFFTPSPNPSPSTERPRPLVSSNPIKDPQVTVSPTPMASAVSAIPPLRIQQNLPETDNNGKISDVQITFTTSDNKIKILRSISLNELASGYPIQEPGLSSGVGYEASLTITRLKASCTHVTVFKGTGKWTPPKEEQTISVAFPDKTSNQACENEADGTAITQPDQSSNTTTVAFNAENDALIRKKVDEIFLAINHQNNDEILKFIQLRTPFYLNNMYYGPFYFQYYNSMEYKNLEIKHYSTEIQAIFTRVVNAPLVENRSILALYEGTGIFRFKKVDQDWYLISASLKKNSNLLSLRSPAAFTGTTGFETVTPLSN